MFHGSMVALVTPLLDNQVDVMKLAELVEWQITAGTQAIVAAGTTGESGTLTHAEKLLVIRTVIEAAQERIPVIAGTAANATAECIQFTQEAMALGAHAALIMTPAYIKPTQEGLYQHYSQVAQSVPMPIILYNVPGRTACDLLPETVARLANFSNIVGIKEATGQKQRLDDLLVQCGDRLDIFSGDDITAAEWMVYSPQIQLQQDPRASLQDATAKEQSTSSIVPRYAGAKGVISVTANVAPQLMVQLCELALSNKIAECLALQEQLMPLHQLLFVESNPIPVKWALYRKGLLSSEIRLPLTPLSVVQRTPLEDALQRLNLL